MLNKNKPKVAIVVITRNRVTVLRRCLNSLKESSFKLSRIIVVDNASEDESREMVKKDFPKVILLSQKINIGAAEGRNVGARVSKSELVYFLDDDAYIEQNTIKSAVETILSDKDIAIVQSKVLSSINPKKILGIAHDINTTTSLITAYGINEIDKGQYSKVMDIPMVGTGWLVKREVFNLVGGFDKKFFIPYEDSDFSLRARNAGYKLYCYSEAKTWHQGHKNTYISPQIEWLGITSPERAYRVARNKMIFMRKHSPFPNNIFFFFVLSPLYYIIHSAIIIVAGRFDILVKYWMGVFSGLIFSLLYFKRFKS